MDVDIDSYVFPNLEDLTGKLKEHDIGTYGHSLRVARSAIRFKNSLVDESDIDVRGLVNTALFHDIGKLWVPRKVLNKEDPLTEAEWRILRQHTVRGYEIIYGRGYPDCAKAVLATHRFQRNPYPSEDLLDNYGVTEKHLNHLSSPVSLFDLLDTARYGRPWKESQSWDEAVEDTFDYYEGDPINGLFLIGDSSANPSSDYST